MPRKKKMERVESLRLDFNGKMLIVIDTNEWGPIEFNVNDRETVLEVMRTLIDCSDNNWSVDSYTKTEGKKLKKMMEEK
jgi:hypothetical protein